MAKELLAREQEKGKEMISSIPCQVHGDFWGSHSPVFCCIRTLSIIEHWSPGSSEFTTGSSLAPVTWEFWEGGRLWGQHLIHFLPGGKLSAGTTTPLKEMVGGQPKDFLITHTGSWYCLSIGFTLGVQITATVELSSICHSFASFQCGVNTVWEAEVQRGPPGWRSSVRLIVSVECGWTPADVLFHLCHSSFCLHSARDASQVSCGPAVWREFIPRKTWG